MKVYVVTEGCYSDYHIEAVFDSYGKAVAYVEAKARRYSDYQIETYDTESAQVTKERKWFAVHMEGGEWTAVEVEEHANGCYTDTYSNTFSKKESIRYVDDKPFRINEYDIDVVARDKEHALKIAQDKFTRYKANKAGI